MSTSNKTPKLSKPDNKVVKIATTSAVVDKRPIAATQRNLQAAANTKQSKASIGSPSQVVEKDLRLFHNDYSRFTAAEALQWNSFISGLSSLSALSSRVESAKDSFLEPDESTTIAGEITAIKALARDLVLERAMDVDIVNSLGWGDFVKTLKNMALMYGSVAPPKNSGGHAADVYEYTVNGETTSIAEETNAHGKTPGNLRSRRGQMREAINNFNAAVTADANTYR